MSRKLSKKAFATTGTCSRYKKLYGITVDEICKGQYTFVWSFKLDEKRAKNEGFDRQSVNGGITLEPDFPGCPYCGSKSFVFCGRCNAMACYNGEGKSTCPKCGYTAKVEAADSFNLKGGSY